MPSNITTYPQLLETLQRLIDGEDTSISTIPVATLTDLMFMGERRVYRETMTRFNAASWATTVTGNIATLPADFIATDIIHFGKNALEPVSESFMLEYLGRTPAGPTKYFCHAGAGLQFGPAVADGTALQGRYFRSLPRLDAASLPGNALFAAAEDLFIYSALAESAPFFGQDARIALWTAKYIAIRDLMNKNDERTAYSTGNMRQRPSTTLMR